MDGITFWLFVGFMILVISSLAMIRYDLWLTQKGVDETNRLLVVLLTEIQRGIDRR